MDVDKWQRDNKRSDAAHVIASRAAAAPCAPRIAHAALRAIARRALALLRRV